jgi:hypothetical protein
MTQISILNGIYASPVADFRTSYPRNMVPVPKSTGIASGYLKPAEGVALFGTGPGGVDRGAINWRGHCYRVQGTKLIRVNADGSVAVLGDVGPGGQVTMDYSFDVLAIASGGRLYYWDGSTLVQVTDPDLGTVIDVVWIDGYFMVTDGETIAVTELNDRMAINPLKYGSSEADPDPINALLELTEEVYVLNRYTIEVLENVGGDGFPFSRNKAAMIPKGAIGTHAACVYMQAIAFVGGARNEAPSIYIGLSGQAAPIATREINVILESYTEAQLANIVMEAKTSKSHRHLLVHLPDRTLVYDGEATKAVGEPVWFTLDSGVVAPSIYKIRNLVWCYDRWIVGDPTSERIGELVEGVSTHWGESTGWDFGTMIVYNEGNGAIVHDLELVGLPGRVAFGLDPVIWTSYSLDGETWSQERPIKAGKQGERMKRLQWRSQGSMENYRVQRFRGTSDAHLSIARLEATFEGLYA